MLFHFQALLCLCFLASCSFGRRHTTRATHFDDLQLDEINDKSLLVVLNASLQACHESHIAKLNTRCYFANEKAVSKLTSAFSKYQKDPENPPKDKALKQVIHEFLEGYAELYHSYTRCERNIDLHDTVFHYKFHFLLDQMSPKPHLTTDRLWLDGSDSAEKYFLEVIRTYDENKYEEMGRIIGQMINAVSIDNEGEIKERKREKIEDEEEKKRRARKLRKMGMQYDPQHDEL